MAAQVQSASHTKASLEMVTSASATSPEPDGEDEAEKSEGEASHASIMEDDGNSEDDILAMCGVQSRPKTASKAASKASAKGKVGKPATASAKSSGSGGAGVGKSVGTAGAKGRSIERNSKELLETKVKQEAAVPRAEQFDPAFYLQQNGFEALQSSWVKLMAVVEASDAFKASNSEDKDFKAALTEFNGLLFTLNKDSIALFWKLKKRVSVPTESVKMLNDFREKVANTMSLFLEFSKKNAARNMDVDKVDRLLKSLQFVLPKRLAHMFHFAMSESFVQFSQLDELIQHLNVALAEFQT